MNAVVKRFREGVATEGHPYNNATQLASIVGVALRGHPFVDTSFFSASCACR